MIYRLIMPAGVIKVSTTARGVLPNQNGERSDRLNLRNRSDAGQSVASLTVLIREHSPRGVTDTSSFTAN
jgi:hypothetical protein